MSKKKRKPQGHPARAGQTSKKARIEASSAEGLLNAYMTDWRDYQLKRVQVLNTLAMKYPAAAGLKTALHYASVSALAMVQVVDLLNLEEETIAERIEKGTI